MIANASSCLSMIANSPKELPNDKEPQSPINISAGYELNQRNPNPAPTSDAAKIATSPLPSIYGINKYDEIFIFPWT